MITYVVVVSLAILGGRSVPIVVGLVLVAMFLPPLVPSWHDPVDVDAAVDDRAGRPGDVRLLRAHPGPTGS